MSSGPGSKRGPRRKPIALLDDLEDAVAEDVAFHLRARSKQPADQVGPLHAAESLDLEGAGKFDQRLRLHLVELGDREVGNVGIGAVGGELLRLHLMGSDFARYRSRSARPDQRDCRVPGRSPRSWRSRRPPRSRSRSLRPPLRFRRLNSRSRGSVRSAEVSVISGASMTAVAV